MDELIIKFCSLCGCPIEFWENELSEEAIDDEEGFICDECIIDDIEFI